MHGLTSLHLACVAISIFNYSDTKKAKNGEAKFGSSYNFEILMKIKLKRNSFAFLVAPRCIMRVKEKNEKRH